jgi:hypothetical protein
MTPENSPAPRTPLNIGVEFRRSYAREESQGLLKNISITGAFLSHRDSNMRPGEKLNLNFSVAGRQREVSATVVWNNTFGCGVRFSPQNNRDVQIIDDLIFFVEAKREGCRGILDQILKKVA